MLYVGELMCDQVRSLLASVRDVRSETIVCRVEGPVVRDSRKRHVHAGESSGVVPVVLVCCRVPISLPAHVYGQRLVVVQRVPLCPRLVVPEVLPLPCLVFPVVG